MNPILISLIESAVQVVIDKIKAGETPESASQLSATDIETIGNNWLAAHGYPTK